MKKGIVNQYSKRKTYLVFIFLTGFTSLIYEIYSTRILFFFFSETNWAITIGITSFLAGIAFSALFFSSFVKKQSKNVFFILCIMQVTISIYGFFFLRQYTLIPYILDFLFSHSSNIVLVTACKIIFIWLFLFVPAFLIGGTFPIVNGLYLNNNDKKIQDTSFVYFWDTFGSLVGGLLTGFWFLPYFGFQLTVTIGVLTNLILAFFITPQKLFRILIINFLIFIIMISTLNIWINTDPARNVFLNNQYLNKRFGNVLFQKTSPYGFVTIGHNSFGIPNNKTLFINYRDMCSSKIHPSETSIGELTSKQLPLHSNVLNIGLGCGFTADAIAKQKNVSNLDIVEINPVVAEGTKKYFSKENNGVLNNPKTNLIIQDGATYIRNSNQKYNAVVIDIEEPAIIDSSPLFTREYFAYIHSLLLQKGILAVWAIKGDNEYEKVIYNTLKTSFKYVSIRIVNTIPSFYASDKKYTNLLPQDKTELSTVSTILNTPVYDVNTLDKRVLEKYFSIQNAFDFPTGYDEPFTSHTQFQ